VVWWHLLPGVAAGLLLLWVALIALLALSRPRGQSLVDLLRLLRRTGPEAIDRHWPGTPEGLATLRRLLRLSGNR
jgi:hypothetical protein